MVFLASLVNELHQDKLCGIPFDFKQTIRFDSFHFKVLVLFRKGRRWSFTIVKIWAGVRGEG